MRSNIPCISILRRSGQPADMRRITGIVTAALLLGMTGCAAAPEPASGALPAVTGHMELSYASQFSVDYCEGGYAVIRIGTEDTFLLVPEDAAIPDGAEEMTVLQQPLTHLYVAASSAMDLFDAAGGLDAVEMTSTAPESWTLPAVQEALASGQMSYIGKYSAPDYELLAASGCGLAVESTMIYHSPEVREKIETLGIPVLTERSSYESHPLGRMEWMKLYGLLLGREAEAQAAFAERTSRFETLEIPDIPEEERPTAAFFSVNSNGSVTIRKPGDYVSQMIALAGGRYCFTAEDLSVEENALSTMNIQMEAFYDAARDADYLIYNSTIEGDLDDLDALLSKSSIFADFRAVKEDHVWCTGQNLFQQTTGAAEMIADLNCIFNGQAEDADALTFLHRLR